MSSRPIDLEYLLTTFDADHPDLVVQQLVERKPLMPEPELK